MPKDTKPSNTTHIRTRLIHEGQRRSPHGETAEALYLTSGYVYASAEEAAARFRGDTEGFIYSRFANPTVRMFEERMVAFEDPDRTHTLNARATASGMAAVTSAFLAQLQAGDHVVSAKALFGSCRYVVEHVLPRFGIAVDFIDGTDLDAWQAALKPTTKVFFLETPSNPRLDVIDLAGVGEIARRAGARLIVDNVFATALLQKPFDTGAHCVVYSATKHIDGQGRCLGGVILGDPAFIDEEIEPFLRNTGPSLSPFNAWVMLKGLETLPLRMDAHCRAALEVAHFLESLPGIRRVYYPHLPSHPHHNTAKAQMSAGGSLVSFEVKGGQAEAFSLTNALAHIGISNNLGDAKSLITHPATTTHYRIGAEARAEMGITDALLRLSVGLEDAADLKDDLARAAETITG